MPLPHLPPLLLLDFDGTLTHSSTIPLLLSLSPSPPSQSTTHLTHLYTTSLSTHTSTYNPPAPLRKTLSSELTFLASLLPVEKESIERLEKAGVWRGVTRERISEVASRAVKGGEVILRHGWEGLCERVMGKGKGGRVGVVSICWSAGFISSILRSGVRMRMRREEEEGYADDDSVGVEVEVENIDIRANEIIFDDADGKRSASGKLDRYFSPSPSSEDTGIWTSEGKLRVMHELIDKSTCENGGMRPWSIYIGDSSTDLGCLIEADVGICVRDEVETGEQRGLREVLERVGVECFYIGEWKERMGRLNDEGSKCLWWARDFEEVRSGILDEG